MTCVFLDVWVNSNNASSTAQARSLFPKGEGFESDKLKFDYRSVATGHDQDA